MKKGASAVLVKPPIERVPADAPGYDATCSRLAGGAAGRFQPAVHRPVVPHVLRPGLRVPRPDGQAHRVRHADRSGPVPVVEP